MTLLTTGGTSGGAFAPHEAAGYFFDRLAAMSVGLESGFRRIQTGAAPQIRGIKNVSGILTNTPAANGDSVTNLDPFAEALGELEANDAHGTAIVMHPRTWKSLTKIKDATGSNRPVLEQQGGGNAITRTIYGVPVFLSSQVSITETQGTAVNATSAYVYEADQIVAVFNKNMEVDVDRSVAFSSDRAAVRVKIRADLVVPNPKAVYRIKGLLP